MRETSDPIATEPKFTFRRIFSYVVGSVILTLLTILVFRVETDAAKETIVICLSINLWWLNTLYIVGPSGEQVFRMLSTVKLAGLPGGGIGRITDAVGGILPSRQPRRSQRDFPDPPFGG